MNKDNLNKILLTQPNYSIFGKKSWKLFPYSLAIINSCIKNKFKTELFDPNFNNLNDNEIINYVRKSNPDLVGISTCSTEYIKETEHMTSLVRKALPNTIIVEGGVCPTVAPKRAIKDKSVDYWVIGEGEKSFPNFLGKLMQNKDELESMITSSNNEDLDSIPFADYGNLKFMDYANESLKYAQGLRARRFPYAVTITSRGCPYKCVFCSGPRVSGKKVRMRSSENVLEEIDQLYKKGIKEIIFLDDHFLFNKNRAKDIMNGLIKRKYDLNWKCVNLTTFLLDEGLVDLMKKSGCYQITSSVESGNQHVVNNLVKKPINLEKMASTLDMIKKRGFESIVNFVIGFPHETWDQIRETVRYAEEINVDLVNFHIATPLPNTELMETCIKEGHLPKNAEENFENIGYTHGIISTGEFLPIDLEILRAFEWDRINFKTEERKKSIARIQGISLEELEIWRRETRRKLGVNVIKK